MIANELRAGHWGFAELGCNRIADRARVRKLFAGGKLRLTLQSSPRVVSWCGVLKNIYVPLIGLSDGLECGDNLRGQLVSAALGEINLLVMRLCGRGMRYTVPPVSQTWSPPPPAAVPTIAASA